MPDEPRYGGYTLTELAELEAKATPCTLHAHGGYLSVRANVSMNIQHIDELGKPRESRAPFQAIPIWRDEDCEKLAKGWDALPHLLARIRELEAENARLKDAMGRDDAAVHRRINSLISHLAIGCLIGRVLRYFLQ